MDLPLNSKEKIEVGDIEQSLSALKARLQLSIIIILGGYLLLVSRLFTLQIIQYDNHLLSAENNRIITLPIIPSRGLIYDRYGKVLAENRTDYALELNLNQIEKVDELIYELSQIIPITSRDRRRFDKIRLESRKNNNPIPIRIHLSDVEVARFASQAWRFPGVNLQVRPLRHYPYREIGAHALGYISRINEREQQSLQEAGLEENYRGTDHIGKIGIEQYYEKLLHGTVGSQQVEVDSSGKIVRSLASTPPISGEHIRLSLDIQLQQMIEYAYRDRKGATVVFSAHTGEILALVSRPSFDPNLFVDGIELSNWEKLNNSPEKPLLNRALRGLYPPGSTFKPFMGLIALKTQHRRPDQTIYDPGYFDFGGHRFRDDKVGGHGRVNMIRSISDSCDTYYYMLANDMGIDTISKEMAEFGFGSPTGIDLEGELSGILPSPEWKIRRFGQKWLKGETISVGIGQGYNTYSPLQLANALAQLVSNGASPKPHLLASPPTSIPASPPANTKWDQSHIAVIRSAMELVPKQGTAAGAFTGASYTSGGKTGTAQVFSMKADEIYNEKMVPEHLRDHAWYIAYAPANDPEIVVATLVENGGFGAQSAAPLVRQILDYLMLQKDHLPSKTVTPPTLPQVTGVPPRQVGNTTP